MVSDCQPRREPVLPAAGLLGFFFDFTRDTSLIQNLPHTFHHSVLALPDVAVERKLCALRHEHFSVICVVTDQENL